MGRDTYFLWSKSVCTTESISPACKNAWHKCKYGGRVHKHEGVQFILQSLCLEFEFWCHWKLI
jgi:hypothetical protein